MSNRCYDHSINNTHSNSHSNSQSHSQSHSLNLSQSQKQQSTSGKRPTPSMASSKCSSANIRHGDRPVLEINCDLANDSQQSHNQSNLVGDSEGRTRTTSISNSNSGSNGLSESGNSAVPTLPLTLAPLVQPQPHYRIPTLPLHTYNNSGSGNSPEENLHLEAQQGGFEGTSTCCELDDQFKEMQMKREECTKRNERVFVSEANAEVLKKILIVDDSVLCQKIIIKVLDGANYSFETAGNGREACEKICELDWDLFKLCINVNSLAHSLIEELV